MKRKSTPQTPEQTASPDKTQVRPRISPHGLSSDVPLERDCREGASQEPIQNSAPAQSVGSVPAAHPQGGFFVFAKPAVFALLLFFAMTVQTAPMALILGVLAFLSLLGKKPVARIRARLSLPMVGLLGFAIVYGAAAIYSPFGDSALAEFYKFFAALALAVILLARYDRADVPGLLWAFAAVSAVIGLVSVDAAGANLIFPAFDRLTAFFGADFSTVNQQTWARRIAGIYNDANVTAFVFALASIVGLHLSLAAREAKKRLTACILLGVNALAFFLCVSRGAILCFAVACLVWLAVAGKGNRAPLFFAMAFSAAVTVACAIPAASYAFTGSPLADGLCVLSGVLMFLLFQFVLLPLSRLAQSHARVVAVCCAALVVLGVGYSLAAVTFTGAYTFTERDSTSLERAVDVEPGIYTLSTEGTASISFSVNFRSDSSRAVGGEAEILLSDGDLAGADGLTFEITEPGRVTVSAYGEPGTVFEKAFLTDRNGSKYAFKLNYPLLPSFLATRLQDSLLGSYSTSMRWTYDLDALKLFVQSPIFGHGLGSTENLYRSVQSFQYESKYAHNHLLQTLSDMGLVGTLCAVAFVTGAAWLCLRAVRREKDALAAALLAAWVMMNLHSLMEINFSVRGAKCAAYVLLVLPVLLWAERPAEETAKARKRAKTVGTAAAILYVLYFAVFGGLLGSARMTDRRAADFQTSDVYEYLDFLRNCVRGDVFDHDFYQRNYVATAVQLNDPSYNGDMLKYVSALRASGTYENDSALAEYYYLPRQKWDDLFACSLEGIHQVRSSPDGWNYQMDFYRTELLPAMGADNVERFLSGVLELGDTLDAMNAEGRAEEVSLTDESQTFLNLCRSAADQDLTGTAAYTVLSLAAGSSGEEGQ